MSTRRSQSEPPIALMPPAGWMEPLNLEQGRIVRWRRQSEIIQTAIVDHLRAVAIAGGNTKSVSFKALWNLAMLMLEQAEMRSGLQSAVARTLVHKALAAPDTDG